MGVLTKFSTTVTAGNFLIYKVGHCSSNLQIQKCTEISTEGMMAKYATFRNMSTTWQDHISYKTEVEDSSNVINFKHRLFQYMGTLLVAQLVEALRYNPEGRGFDSRWCHWNFSLT